MRRLFQQPLGWCLVAGVLLAVLAIAPVSSPGQALARLPRIDKAEHKAYTEPIPGTEVKFDMVSIPGGAYLMGSPSTEAGRAEDEGPQHPVEVRPFWMARCEVTWDEYDLYRKERAVESPSENERRVKENADAVTGPTPPYADETFGHGREGHPVLCVTWHAATEYCRWLSQKTGKVYRLPTEAEWEWACRAGTTTPYFFGDDAKQLGDYEWFADNSEEIAHEVGKKKPNPWGLHDIAGNLSEWCLDQFDKGAYAKFPLDKLTLGPVLLPGPDRFPHVARGGSWADKAQYLRSAARRGSDKSWIKLDPQRPQSIWWLTSAEFVGFRVVRPLAEQDNLKGFKSKVTRESR